MGGLTTTGVTGGQRRPRRGRAVSLGYVFLCEFSPPSVSSARFSWLSLAQKAASPRARRPGSGPEGHQGRQTDRQGPGGSSRTPFLFHTVRSGSFIKRTSLFTVLFLLQTTPGLTEAVFQGPFAFLPPVMSQMMAMELEGQPPLLTMTWESGLGKTTWESSLCPRISRCVHRLTPVITHCNLPP